MDWIEAQEWERKWHDNCTNSYEEETKQINYANRMGLKLQKINGKYPVIDFHNKSVVDIGGGPYSLLLKGINLKGTVVDPCDYPLWVGKRYEAVGLKYIKAKGEDYNKGHYDIGLIYNVLQHTENPQKVIENMRKMCDIIYLHEWLDTPISDGHIHTLKEEDLNKWLDDRGLIGYEKWNNEIFTPYYHGLFI
jgi:2-polyprenyl-3-methyl-5-hydroxy-6-metoxy-1,4-benzoquinol methylase